MGRPDKQTSQATSSFGGQCFPQVSVHDIHLQSVKTQISRPYLHGAWFNGCSRFQLSVVLTNILDNYSREECTWDNAVIYDGIPWKEFKYNLTNILDNFSREDCTWKNAVTDDGVPWKKFKYKGDIMKLML